MLFSQYLFKTQQQLVRVQELCTFSLQSGMESVAVVAKLIAALHDQRHGIVVTSGQLVSVKDADLGLRHHLLGRADKHARTHARTLNIHHRYCVIASDVLIFAGGLT